LFAGVSTNCEKTGRCSGIHLTLSNKPLSKENRQFVEFLCASPALIATLRPIPLSISASPKNSLSYQIYFPTFISWLHCQCAACRFTACFSGFATPPRRVHFSALALAQVEGLDLSHHLKINKENKSIGSFSIP
jgi:hypothetical protein